MLLHQDVIPICMCSHCFSGLFNNLSQTHECAIIAPNLVSVLHNRGAITNPVVLQDVIPGCPEWAGALAISPVCILLCQLRTLDTIKEWSLVGVLLVLAVMNFLIVWSAERIEEGAEALHSLGCSRC